MDDFWVHIGDGEVGCFLQEEPVVEAVTRMLEFNYIEEPVSEGDGRRGQPPTSTNGCSILKLAYRVLPYSLGLPTFDGKLTLVCMTSISESIFWDYVAEKLELKPGVITKTGEKEVAIQLSEIAKLSVITVPKHLSTLRLLYTKQTWFSFDGPSLTLKHDLDFRKDAALSKVYDRQEVSRILLDYSSVGFADLDKSSSEYEADKADCRNDFFKRIISSIWRFWHWARSTGLLGGQFGLLTDEMLVLLFIKAFQELDYRDTEGNEDTIPQDLLQTRALNFVDKVYSKGGDCITVTTPSGFPLDPISVEGTRAFSYAIGFTDHGDEPKEEWSRLARNSFLEEHERFLTVNANCWVPRLRGELAKMLPSILLALQNRFRGDGERHRFPIVSIWPFCLSTPQERTDGEYRYVLGICHPGRRPTTTERDDDYMINVILDSFMSRVKTDVTSMALDIQITPKDHIEQLLRLGSAEQDIMITNRITRRLSALWPKLDADNPRFRTAAEVMSRLRWDPCHASNEYEVGYVDRFQEDLVWKPLHQWEKHTEEEDFVPEHRIQQIRGKAYPGTVVWDRDTRFDGTDTGSKNAT